MEKYCGVNMLAGKSHLYNIGDPQTNKDSFFKILFIFHKHVVIIQKSVVSTFKKHFHVEFWCSFTELFRFYALWIRILHLLSIATIIRKRMRAEWVGEDWNVTTTYDAISCMMVYVVWVGWPLSLVMIGQLDRVILMIIGATRVLKFILDKNYFYDNEEMAWNCIVLSQF